MSLLHVTAMPGEVILVYRNGCFSDLLHPGERARRRSGSTFVRVPTRERTTALATQEVGTADGLQVRATAVTRWKVVDARAFHELAEDPEGAVYLATQVALRDLLADLEATVLVQRLRTEPDLGQRLLHEVQGAVARYGIEVMDAVVKDVLLPAEVRAAATALVTARARGLAELEQARSRTAALRALANGAKLLDDHPALARMQLVEAAPMGSQVVLNLGGE